MKKLSMEELNRLSVDEFKKSKKTQIVVILENIRSLHNIGSVFRTCDAFRIEEIFLCGITACPPNKEIHKTALGATETVNWSYETNSSDTILKLKQLGYTIIAVEQADNSIKLDEVKFNNYEKLAFIFGNEVNGVDQISIDNSDLVLEIPQIGSKHSLNVSVCSGIVLWEAFKAL